MKNWELEFRSGGFIKIAGKRVYEFSFVPFPVIWARYKSERFSTGKSFFAVEFHWLFWAVGFCTKRRYEGI